MNASRGWRHHLRSLLGLALALLLLAVGMVWGRSPAGVDWQRVRAVCIESDDWGLCGFVPDSAALGVLDRDVLAPGRLPEIYWHSTLEDSAAVAALCDVLAGHRGRDGLSALMQPNYIMASLTADTTGGDSLRWRRQALPAVPPGYERPGLWAAVRAGQRAGVWHPELHGRFHYDPRLRRERTVGPPVVAAARAQVLPFPGSERAWELGPWRDPDTLAAELDASLADFAAVFGRPPRAVIGPDYVWDDPHESLWLSRDLRVIQGQRQQRKASWRGLSGRVRKVLHRSWMRWVHRDRVYLDRNCIFEPVQQHDPRAITAGARRDIRAAWRRGEPAVVEAHRINFAHLDPRVPALGRGELDSLLAAVSSHAPLYLVDEELAGLQRRGTSWTVRGEQVVVRNLTRSRRLVVVPPRALNTAARLAGTERPPAGRSLVLALGPGETRILGPAARIQP